MGIKITWDNDEKTILRYSFDTHWTWDDFYTAKAEAYNQIDTVQHKVGVIFDAPEKITLPANMITHSKSAVSKTHPNTCIVAVVVRNLYLRTMLSMVMKLSKKAAETLRLVSSLDEARALVAEKLREANLQKAS
jgi:hypothetical protein